VACSSRSRRGSGEPPLDPGLKLLDRVERVLELAQLGPVDGRREQAERLEARDGGRRELSRAARSIAACRRRDRARSTRAASDAASPASASA
jgi:hypothetical protein